MSRPSLVIATLASALALALPAAAAAEEVPTTRYGFVTFPEDEHQHRDGWNYWWGAIDIQTKSGNRYTLGVAYDSFYGAGAAGQVLYPMQGPYEGETILTLGSPTEWGGNIATGETVGQVSDYVRGVSDLPSYRTLDVVNGLEPIDQFERIGIEHETYRLRMDQDRARLHPDGTEVRMAGDFRIRMKSPPLLLGGTGQWWYGIPQTYKYPSRSYQYMQGSHRVTGTLELEQPDGSILRERLAPKRSTMSLVREYDATPEDLFLGLGLAESTQLGPRYFQYYQGGMPWDLFAMNLDNGAQLMLAVLAFHESRRGIAKPIVGPDQPTYQVLATLRLPTGESVPLDDHIRVEHLDYRRLVGYVPTFAIQTKGVWTQTWRNRVSMPRTKLTTPLGQNVTVPRFDIGLRPQIPKSEPALDDFGNGLMQRVPYLARGTYAGCPIKGFGWSESIVNYYGYEDDDPFFTGREMPRLPRRCKSGRPADPPPPPGDLDPPPNNPPLNTQTQGCVAMLDQPKCVYTAREPGGIGGTGPAPKTWRVTIERPGRPGPLVIEGKANGPEIYTCGTIRKGDRVTVTATAGAYVFAGNPGFCI
jgi:hypothetical protein